MDPDVCLALMRERIQVGLALSEAGLAGEAHEALVEAAEHARDLDEWLSRGGFPPKAWGPVVLARSGT